jgi:tetratricopeptide (TPR) repeat protein
LPELPTEPDAANQMRDLERARALFRAERLQECLAVGETILRRGPSHRGASFLLGVVRARSNDLSGALLMFEKLTQLDPAHGNGWLQRGLCLIGLMRFAEAAESLRRSTVLRPDNAIGLGHYGGALGITLDTIPSVTPYLRPSADLIEAWKRRLAAVPGLRVGLAWSAAARTCEPWAEAYGRRRSMPLDRLAPLASIRGVSFVSLQFGTGADQAVHPPTGMELNDFGESIGDFEETAAVIANLDLVISVDASTAHLAGAIGKPVMLISAFDQDWRWILGRADSPWYPMHRIFRQTTSGDWTSVVHDVASALRDFAAGRQ